VGAALLTHDNQIYSAQDSMGVPAEDCLIMKAMPVGIGGGGYEILKVKAMAFHVRHNVKHKETGAHFCNPTGCIE